MRKNSKVMTKNTRIPFDLILGTFFLLMLLLNLLTPMAVDDYTYAFRFDTGERLTSVADIFPSLAAHAQVMNGRLFPHFFVHLFTLLPRWIFSVTNAIIYTLFLWGIHRLCKGPSERDASLLCTLASALFLLTPAFGQSFLWMAGSINYLWCDAMLIFLLIPFADHLLSRRETPAKGIPFLSILFALWFGNTSENVSAAAIALMVLCMVYLMIQHRKVPLWMIFTTLSALMGWLLLMLAPANLQNASTSLFEESGALLRNFDHAMAVFRQHGIALSVIYFVMLSFALHAPTRSKDILAFSFFTFLCSLLCHFMMVGAHYFPLRAFTGVLLLQLVSCAFLVPMIPARKALVFALALSMGFCTALEGLDALRNNYDRYQLAQARVQEIQNAGTDGEHLVHTFGISGKTKYDPFYDIIELTNIPSATLNVAYAKYYGLAEIAVDRME